MEGLKNKVAQRLITLREQRGWTKTQVADKLGKKLPTYANWEYGIKKPSIDTVKDLAKLYNVTTDYILGEDNNVQDVRYTPIEALKHTYSADGKPVPLEDIETLAKIIEQTIRANNA